VIGHSRGGKTALWAGAEDERFAYVISNDSGSTGAAIARNKEGEHIRDINRGFPHWFCDNYKQFNDREDALPIDQTRTAGVDCAAPALRRQRVEDQWSDPRNEFLATVHASPVYELLGRRAWVRRNFRRTIHRCRPVTSATHVRSGKHNLTLYDWQRYMDSRTTLGQIKVGQTCWSASGAATPPYPRDFLCKAAPCCHDSLEVGFVALRQNEPASSGRNVPTSPRSLVAGSARLCAALLVAARPVLPFWHATSETRANLWYSEEIARFQNFARGKGPDQGRSPPEKLFCETH